MRMLRVTVFHKVGGRIKSRSFYYQTTTHDDGELGEELVRTCNTLRIEEVECFCSTECSSNPIHII